MGNAIDRTLGEQAVHDLETRGGLRLDLRPVTLDDGPLLADLFDRLTVEDLRFRFLTGLDAVKPHQVATMLEVDHRQAEHLLAFDKATGTLVASVMIVADPAMEVAEVAVVVAREFRGKGIGWTLLRHATDLARERGIRTLRSVESRANHDALEVERTLGFEAHPYDGDPTMVLVEASLA
ncbi:GNAT family N-acetyltransferase [Qipengyuania zhejiangensis]|uniref:GNAT family N-acetyltransferase n=1 Tax=Qipengyuania zhejiangensis TaxID=3077782 RepID=UPI002D7683EB|nr:GNAT family N-acetyltransferase [Qipengyuania sp. Z2]